MRIHPEMLKQLKAYYTPCIRVCLVRMDDPYTKLTPGATGTVSFVDILAQSMWAGTAAVVWAWLSVKTKSRKLIQLHDNN